MTSEPSYVPPLQGCSKDDSITQGVALGWYVTPLQGAFGDARSGRRTDRAVGPRGCDSKPVGNRSLSGYYRG